MKSWRVTHGVSSITALFVAVVCSALAFGQESPRLNQDGREAKPPVPGEQAIKRPMIGDPLNMEMPKISPGPKLTLAEAIDLTERRNLTLAAARVDLEMGRAELKSAWSKLLPTAQATMSFTHNDKADTTSFAGSSIEVRPQETLIGGVQAILPLITPEGWLGVRASRESVVRAELTLENVRQQRFLATAEAYYQALTSLALIRVQENLLGAALRHMEVARMRHVNGVGRRIDVIRARSEVVRVRGELTTSHSAFDNSRDALGILTGKGGLPLPEEGFSIAVPEGNGEELAGKGSQKRLDLRMGRQGAKLRDRELDMAWMKFLPTLTLSWQLTHQFTDPSPSSFGSRDKTRWNAVAALTVPLYDHTRYAALDGKRAALKKAIIETKDAEKKADLEIRTAYRNYLTSLKQLEISAEQADLSREALLLAEKAYESGTGSSLDVTDASRTSRSDEVTLAIKRFEIQLAVLRLLSAVGDDLSEVVNTKKRG